jgi:hypothetical protein
MVYSQESQSQGRTEGKVGRALVGARHVLQHGLDVGCDEGARTGSARALAVGTQRGSENKLRHTMGSGKQVETHNGEWKTS